MCCGRVDLYDAFSDIRSLGEETNRITGRVYAVEDERDAIFALRDLLAAVAEGARRNVAGAVGLTNKAIFVARKLPGIDDAHHEWAADVVCGVSNNVHPLLESQQVFPLAVTVDETRKIIQPHIDDEDWVKASKFIELLASWNGFKDKDDKEETEE